MCFYFLLVQIYAILFWKYNGLIFGSDVWFLFMVQKIYKDNKCKSDIKIIQIILVIFKIISKHIFNLSKLI